MSYQRIESANKDSITLADGTILKTINYRNHLPLYDKNGTRINNLDQFYNENGQFLSASAPLLIGLYVDPTYVGGGSSRRNNYKKSVRRVKSAKRASRSRSRKYRNRK
jgi:hypothetical protein